MKYSKHAEYKNEFGREVPSVTTILKILNKPALCKWANYLGFKRQNIDKVLEESANKGTEVHFMLNAFLFKKKFIYIDGKGVDKNYLTVVLDNFITWLNGHTLKPILGEEPITSYLYGGTVDLYCELDGKKTILDFKTSKNFYSSMFLQLAAYTTMMEAIGYEVDQVAILLINDKMCKHRIIRREELDEYMEIFDLLAQLFYHIYDLNEYWGDLIQK